jgi:hypothetical protein
LLDDSRGRVVRLTAKAPVVRDVARAKGGRGAGPDRRRTRRASGLFLLEALVALLMFALATIGFLGVLSAALRDNGNAQWRGSAFDLAASTLSQMWAEDAGTLAAGYDAPTSGSGYQALLAAALRLPGVTRTDNVPAVTVEDAPGGRRHVVVTVQWQLPTETGAHRASVRGVLPGP